MKHSYKKSIASFIKKLEKEAHSPGGGTAAVLLGMLGCGLLGRVAHSTLAKRGFNGYKERAKKVLKESTILRMRLADLIDKEALAYERLAKVLRMSESRTSGLQPALKKTVILLSKVCRCAHKASALSVGLAYVGDTDLITDVCVAIYVLDAAFESALVNIKGNFKLIRDKNYVLKNTHLYTVLHKDIKKMKTEVLSKAKERMFT